MASLVLVLCSTLALVAQRHSRPSITAAININTPADDALCPPFYNTEHIRLRVVDNLILSNTNGGDQAIRFSVDTDSLKNMGASHVRDERVL